MHHMLPLSVVAVTVAAAAPAQQPPTQADAVATPAETASWAQPLFASHDVLQLTLEAEDLKQLVHDVGENRVAHLATLTYLDSQSAPVSIALEVETRGHFRRDRRNCNFPPLRLEFPDSGTAQTLFAHQRDLKLVVHCQDGRDDYEQYVLQEYLIYRIYNLLTDRSFRVRLAQVTYRDRKGEREPLTKYGFLIEDHQLMAARNGCEILEVQAHPLEFSPAETVRMALFQYMIGNTDWSITYLHNVRLLMCENHEPVAVPYDFDWSGVIAARYAKPDPKLGIRTVRQRLFRGFCRSDDLYREAAGDFLRRKDAIYQLYREQADLEPKLLERTLEYFDEFYRTLNDPKRFQREILDECRKA